MTRCGTKSICGSIRRESITFLRTHEKIRQ
jgi:hypothetical protein